MDFIHPFARDLVFSFCPVFFLQFLRFFFVDAIDCVRLKGVAQRSFSRKFRATGNDEMKKSRAKRSEIFFRTTVRNDFDQTREEFLLGLLTKSGDVNRPTYRRETCPARMRVVPTLM